MCRQSSMLTTLVRPGSLTFAPTSGNFMEVDGTSLLHAKVILSELCMCRALQIIQVILIDVA